MTNLSQIYCCVHQKFQINSIWVSLCGGPTISLWIFCLCNSWMILLFLCYLTFRRLCDGVYFTSKCSKFVDDRIFTIPCKVRWDVVQSTVYSTSINICWCLCCTSPFIFMLITIKKSCSYHIVGAFVASFVLSFDPRCITTSSFHGYFELINE